MRRLLAGAVVGAVALAFGGAVTAARAAEPAGPRIAFLAWKTDKPGHFYSPVWQPDPGREAGAISC